MRKKSFSLPPPPWVAAGLGLALLLFLFGKLFWEGGRVLSALGTDFSDYFLPMTRFGFSEIRNGRIPLWSPYTFSGQPFAANFESALFYPPNWVHLFLPPSTAFNILAVFHVLLAGLGFYLWARSWKLSTTAAWVSSAAFMFGGAFLPRLYAGQISNVYSICWAPFIFWCLERMRDKLSLGVWMMAVLGVSMQILAGHPQYALYTLLAALLYIALGAGGAADKLKIAGRLSVVYLAALGLDSVQVLTSLDALMNCRRSLPLSTEAAAYNSLSPPYLLTLGMQYVFGRDVNAPSPWPPFPYWGEDFWENTLFLGGTACWLAVFALVTRIRGSLRPVGFTALCVALLSLGSHLPLYPVLLKVIPFFDRLRGTNKFAFLVVLMTALLCGMGLDKLLSRSKANPGVFVTLGSFGLLFGLMGLYWISSARQGPSGAWWGFFHNIDSNTHFLDSVRPEDREYHVRWLGYNFGACFILAGLEGLVLSLLFYLAPRKKILVYLIAAVVATQSLFFAKVNERDFHLADQAAKAESIRESLQTEKGDFRVLINYGESAIPFEKDAWGVNTFAISRYVLFLAKTQGLEPEQVMNKFKMVRPDAPSLGLLRLHWFMDVEGTSLKSAALSVSPVPRFQLLDRWKIVPDGGKALEAVFATSFNPRKEMILEKVPAPAPLPGPPGHLQVEDLSTNTLEFRVQTIHPSLLFVGENFFPGWKIHDLSLKPVQPGYEILAADYFLRAVPLAAGIHHFQMRYEPASFRLGLWLSLVFCAFFTVMGLQGWTRLFSRKS